VKNVPPEPPEPAGKRDPQGALAAQRRMVEALRDPARYPFPVAAVSLIETHISFVLLTGTFAYKIKKAVDFGFLDCTRLEQRRFFCEEELRLNRRLSTHFYLGVVAIGGSADDPYWEGEAVEAIEYAVKMEEFAQEDLLDRVLMRGALSAGHIDALAAAIAALHSAAPVAAPVLDYGSPHAVQAVVDAAFSQLRPLAAAADHALVEDIESWMAAEYRRLRPLFARRKLGGSVRECHGDLHLSNIALLRGELQIFDAIDFAPQLRWIDVASDLAFLLMDLSQRGRTDYAWRLLNEWLEITGDYAGLSVLLYYQVYRALVRALVSRLHAAEPALPSAVRDAASATEIAYLRHAAALRAPRVRALLVTHGFSGAGKSTLARAVGETFGVVRITSDIERKRRHGLPPFAHNAATDTLYSKAATATTYQELGRLARLAIGAGYPVIIDAACLERSQRMQFRFLAQRLGVPFLLLDCQAPPALLRHRVSRRAEVSRDASDATLPMLERQIETADPLGPDELDTALRIDSGENFDVALAQIRRHLFEG
jgi:uncharacterized protein